ncbi:MATE family efflux transporter [Paenibacillus sedimenti]|uniref:MATE family efflux transporter n=1 Tax=Paenibacillus sedimenti TaxID=2770274 RepID=A0A926QHY0_9BACL|nr:MATE family efflux transporter [Paenibacillus sedimenti]MBD0378999.1 MATE family efflux transporter [Paenibacillus sedimenti]
MPSKSEIDTKRLSLWHLSWPLAIEMLLQFLMGTLDSLMVSHISDNAVSAVGLSNQVIQSIMTIFFLINSGAGVVVARKWGAGKRDEARKTVFMTLKLNVYGGIVMSLILYAAAEPIIRMMNAPGEVHDYAVTYLRVVGAGMFVTLLHLSASAVIRSTGNTRGPMLISVGMNLIHLGSNSVLIFGFMGFPELGILGVSISTVASRSVALLCCLWLLYQIMKPGLRWTHWKGIDRPLLKEMLSIGVPSIFTSFSWGISQIVVLSIVSSLGETQLASYTYMNVIQQLPWVIGSAVGAAVQIQVSQYYGAGRHDLVYPCPYHGARVGMAVSFLGALAAWASAPVSMGWFTSSQAVIETALPVFAFCLVWQPLRIWTYTLTNALNSIGEARFVAVISVLGMWLTTTAGAYLLGIAAGWGIYGVFGAFMIDELFRAILAWKRWQRKGLLTSRNQTPAILEA